MSADLLAIARSGTRAARAALDLTAQNIANADTAGYVRRSVATAEVATTHAGGMSLSGVRVAGINRNADAFRQAEVRRTGSDAARASAEVSGLEDIETAVEQGGLYDASVKFEGALAQLAADPTDGSLRAAVVSGAQSLASAFNVTAKSLDATGEGLRFEAKDGVAQVNLLTGELAKVNAQLQRSSGDQTALLDQRDALLEKLSGQIDISTTFNANNTVEVRIGDAQGPQLVSGKTTGTLAMTTAADGTIAFTANGAAAKVSGGALAGKSQALAEVARTRSKVDTIAASVMETVNDVQTAGVDLDGASGQPLFSGTGAADMGVALTSGSQLATAPAGAEKGSRDARNLTALRNALTSANPSGAVDTVLFDVSSAVAGRTVTRDALVSIAKGAQGTLQAQSGVDLDEEAVNLVRFQQAFQASSRVMQVANDLFDTLLGIR